MRVAGMVLAMVLAAGPLTAQVSAAEKKTRCAESAAIVMTAVQARKDGESKAKARRTLRKELDRTAGEMLADWIWDLPEEQLTEEVGQLWEAQCLAQ
ncbi:hypothetical protein M4578_03065 [Salipiger sp. P9]|uniref:hypothetical protein n=1 Tax=Salipiger pentaromativorans TaxID=2943193 RepID=UPI00215756A4|nr:hypothetical protein [Salipiger pentaromativorans]MCR8546795.1 hypothetical protein [Salipiger pentaromativorans]